MAEKVGAAPAPAPEPAAAEEAATAAAPAMALKCGALARARGGGGGRSRARARARGGGRGVDVDKLHLVRHKIGCRSVDVDDVGETGEAVVGDLDTVYDDNIRSGSAGMRSLNASLPRSPRARQLRSL